MTTPFTAASAGVEAGSHGDVLAGIGVPRHAEDVLTNVAEAAAVALDRLVAVADAQRSEPRRCVRDVGVEDVTRGVELVREALFYFFGYGIEAHVLGGIEGRRLHVAFVEAVPHGHVHFAVRTRAEVQQRVDPLRLGFRRRAR